MAHIHACRSPSQQSGKKADVQCKYDNSATIEGFLEDFNPGTHAHRGRELGLKHSRAKSSMRRHGCMYCTDTYENAEGPDPIPPPPLKKKFSTVLMGTFYI